MDGSILLAMPDVVESCQLWRARMIERLTPAADVETVKRAILQNWFVRISEDDAERVAEWAQSKGEGEVGLLLIGRTGMGKSVLIQELMPLFNKPVNRFVEPWKRLKEIDWARPLIIDHTNLGGEKHEREWIEALNECRAPLLVTAFSDLEGLGGEWI
jgi:hypothetical protein